MSHALHEHREHAREAVRRPRLEAASGLRDNYFGTRVPSRFGLPDPSTLLLNLARCVVEVLAGVRGLDQLSRWVTDDVYRHLLKRVVLASRARQVTGGTVRRPQLTVGEPRITYPREDAIEAVVVVHQRSRSRAVAIRLESFEGRWRASAINVL
ncbi:Rv3235 family protein [Diaminobutyricibacter tongyongensis]|uniref:Rv3235 family protein n=1 Tax=Leifsonia tongyongensis TaxID=1268043 RepID=UPI001F03DDE1|nr:Rv3235 family protein [Diaminobutyricibacter tongyongensis]